MTESQRPAERKTEKEQDKDEKNERRKDESEQWEVEVKEPLTQSEIAQVEDHRRLSARSVYTVILAEGEEELSRPTMSLILSGIAAGVAISTSVMAEGALHAKLVDHAYRELLQDFGYSVGFILVILSRLQLFTENTISVVLPLLYAPRRDKLLNSARLWGVVLLANMVGCAATAFLTLSFGSENSEIMQGMIEVSRHYVGITGWDAMLRGVPAGFLIAAVVWMLPSSKGSEVFVILIFTYLIAMTGMTHVVAGATEVFLIVFSGDLAFLDGVIANLLPTLAGNVIGGTFLFAVLAHAQVSTEV